MEIHGLNNQINPIWKNEVKTILNQFKNIINTKAQPDYDWDQWSDWNNDGAWDFH